jgi:hypothetical protein
MATFISQNMILVIINLGALSNIVSHPRQSNVMFFLKLWDIFDWWADRDGLVKRVLLYLYFRQSFQQLFHVRYRSDLWFLNR